MLSRRCVSSRAEYEVTMTYGLLSAISGFSLSIVFTRLLLRKLWRGRQKVSLAKLMENLIVMQASWDLLYTIVDIIYVTDCQAPPITFILNGKREKHNTYQALLHSRTIYYLSLRDGFALLSLCWHCNIAYALYGVVSLKLSPGRLSGFHLIPIFVAASVSITVFRLFLELNVKEDMLGLYLSKGLNDLILIPLALIMMLRWYLLTAWVLFKDGQAGRNVNGSLTTDRLHVIAAAEEVKREDPAGGRIIAQQLETIEEGGGAADGGPRSLPLLNLNPSTISSSMSFSSYLATTCLPCLASTPPSSYSTDDGSKCPTSTTPSTAASSSSSASINDARNRFLVCRVMIISLAVSIPWMLILILDLYLWLTYLFKTSAIPSMGIIGMVDAIVFGVDFNCCLRLIKAPARLARPLMVRLSSMVHTQAGKVSEVSGHANWKDLIKVHLQEEAQRNVERAEMINHQRAQEEGHKIEAVRLFVSTYNIGGVSNNSVTKEMLKDLFPRWIPLDYDLYVIGVQECECLEKLRESLHDYLGVSDQYRLYGAEIGDDSFLGQIAVTILVRVSDVLSGAVEIHPGAVTTLATGVNLGFKKAGNKGVVGLSIRYHDANIAVIGGHFCSNTNGQNRIKDRNKNARMTLKELSLMWDLGGFSVNHQHHHVILLGDLNYRMQGLPEDIISRIVQSADQSRRANAMQRVSSAIESASIKIPLSEPLGLPPSHQLASQTQRLLSDLSDATSSSCISSSTTNNWRAFRYSRLFALPLAPRTQGLAGLATPIDHRMSSLSPTASLAEVYRENGNRDDGQEEGKQSIGENMDFLPPRPPGMMGLPSCPSTIEECWSWTAEMDELTQVMAEGHIFWGFKEEPLKFPPSYRWRRYSTSLSTTSSISQGKVKEEELTNLPPDLDDNTFAGDFTCRQRTLSAYTIHVHNKSIFPVPQAFSSQHSWDESERSGRSKRNQQQQSSLSSLERFLGATTTTSARTPSYTDRILTHSLPGKAPYLLVKAYDMADEVMLSDHRPIAAAMELMVDRRVRGYHVNQGEEDANATTSMLIKQSEGDMAVFTFTMSRMKIEGKDQHCPLEGNILSEYDGVIAFPLINEDTAASERMVSDLSEAIPTITKGRMMVDKKKIASSSSRFRRIDLTAPHVRFEMVASRRFSEHLLIKVKDARGSVVGETVIPVSLGLEEVPSIAIGREESKEAPTAASGGVLFDQAGNRRAKQGLMGVSQSDAFGDIHDGDDGSVIDMDQPPASASEPMLPHSGKWKGRSVTFPLASSGEMTGWLTCQLKVSIKPLELGAVGGTEGANDSSMKDRQQQ